MSHLDLAVEYIWSHIYAYEHKLFQYCLKEKAAADNEVMANKRLKCYV